MPTHIAKAKEIARDIQKELRSPKIDVKKAVTIADQYFRDLFPAAAKANMMLEEIEEGGDGKRWLVTIGYDRAARRTMMDLGGVDRAYKTFAIDNVTGKVISVKIRSAA